MKAGKPSKSFNRCHMIEVPKRSQHLLSEVWTPYSSFGHRLQGGKSTHTCVGDTSSGSTKTRLWRTKVSRAQAYSKNSQEIATETQMQNLQLHHNAFGNQS